MMDVSACERYEGQSTFVKGHAKEKGTFVVGMHPLFFLSGWDDSLSH